MHCIIPWSFPFSLSLVPTSHSTNLSQLWLPLVKDTLKAKSLHMTFIPAVVKYGWIFNWKLLEAALAVLP